MEITFLRHGRSEANEAGIWQGRREGGRLSVAGRRQAGLVSERLAQDPPDLVISSGLERADETVASLGVPVETDPAWAEMDLGEWDGLTLAEITELYADELMAVFAGQPVPLGRTGETIAAVRRRLGDARDALESRLDEGDTALVVTHGGVIETLARLHWGIDSPTAPFAGPLNTSLTRFSYVFGRLRLATYNDTGHLGPRSEWIVEREQAGEPVITLVRHGQTDANLEGRVQGQTDWGLNEVGRQQAATVAEWYGRQPRVYASPLGRAAQTASALAQDGIVEMAEFAELDFGSWEGLTFEEVRTEKRHADLADRIFRHGEDLPRGGNGETWEGLTERMTAGINSIVAADGNQPVTIVSHGGAIRAYLLGNMGVGWPEALETVVPANTAVSHVVLTDEGPILADYGVAIHLESA